jgi:hypothetical protein
VHFMRGIVLLLLACLLACLLPCQILDLACLWKYGNPTTPS